ncbi:MAG TPA: histidine phosphatase family protein [Thermomicrobiales bacterium]|jgi:broad specificity phosphatase PhoE
MQLLLVRHGESAGNLSRRLQSHDDALTERGRRQAGEVAALLAERGDIRALYSSPLIRALETAQIIGTAIGLAPIPLDDLAEINVGEAAGSTFEEWAARNPESAAQFHAAGPNFVWPGGESGLQLAARVAAAVDAIISAHRLEGGSVVIVSHGGALSWMIDHLLREPREQWPQHQLHNCSLTEVTIDADEQAVTFVCRNEIGHLSPEPEEAVALGQSEE